MSEKEQKQLIVFPRGQLDAKTRERMMREGYLAVEADDPRAVVTVLPLAGLMTDLAGDEIVRCMAIGLLSNINSYYAFGKAMAELIAKKTPK
jgi:hypothetical protein